jgi:RNA polymerase sigma-70 factor, ECF subfamily
MTDEAYRKAVVEHKDRVHSCASWMLRDRDQARDVAQEALLRLWRERLRVEAEAAKNWLLRTVHNLCIDRLRAKAARPDVPAETVEPLLHDPAPGPERAAVSEQVGRELERALGTLTPRDRAMVLMREVQGMAYEEIARALDLPLGTLKAALHRSREKLRIQLSNAGVRP